MLRCWTHNVAAIRFFVLGVNDFSLKKESTKWHFLCQVSQIPTSLHLFLLIIFLTKNWSPSISQLHLAAAVGTFPWSGLALVTNFILQDYYLLQLSDAKNMSPMRTWELEMPLKTPYHELCEASFLESQKCFSSMSELLNFFENACAHQSCFSLQFEYTSSQ